MKEQLKHYGQLALYGAALAALLFLLRWLEFRLFIVDHATELYLGAIAILFTGLGIWLAKRLTRPAEKVVIREKTVYVASPDSFVRNEKAVQELRLSRRELEVLELLAAGNSNEEIAQQLFVAVSTVKTHLTTLYEKMDVRRRTQAVDKARSAGIIP